MGIITDELLEESFKPLDIHFLMEETKEMAEQHSRQLILELSYADTVDDLLARADKILTYIPNSVFKITMFYTLLYRSNKSILKSINTPLELKVALDKYPEMVSEDVLFELVKFPQSFINKFKLLS